MDAKTFLQADYLDIIFDNRNKIYGGYELRKHYDRRIVKAGGLIALGVGALICCSSFSKRGTADVKGKSAPLHICDLNITPLPKIHPEIKHEMKPPLAQHIKVKIFIVPVIDRTDNVPADKQMTQNKDLADAHPGLTGSDGDSTGLGGVVTESGRGGGIVMEPAKPAKPLMWVQQMPQFTGDINAFMGSSLRYPAAASGANIEGTVYVQFVVNEDGAVSNATVLRGIGGGCDEEALRVVNSMPKWKPGKQNGMPVKVFFTLPIRFVLQ
jgi:protein TonB